MKPYLAIVKDSFREAMASRVLWILLILITLALLALAPLGYQKQFATEFRSRDILDARQLAEDIRSAQAPSPGARIWAMWDEPTRETIEKFADLGEDSGNEFVRGRQRLAEALNQVLEKQEFYDEPSWSEEFLDAEAKDLAAAPQSDLTKLTLARRNRLLIEQPFSRYFIARSTDDIAIMYFWWKIPFMSFPITEERLTAIIERYVLTTLIGQLVGFVGVLAGILVTSGVIPQMFDQGQLHLLLSKPVSRSLMFVSKFLGGCSFVMIDVAYLALGLWLIAGTRFGIWNKGLLWCIPIFMFLFLIYYSVSAISGVIWKNAVISIVMVVLFWVACFAVGTTKETLELLIFRPWRIVDAFQAGDDVFAVTEMAGVQRWDPDEGKWQDIIRGGNPDMTRILGPVYDASSQRVVAAHTINRSFFTSTPQLIVTGQDNEWQQINGVALPENTIEIMADGGGQLIAVTNRSVHRLQGSVDKKDGATELKLPWVRIPLEVGQPFLPVGPLPEMLLAPPHDAAVNPDTGQLVVFSRGVVRVLAPDASNRYRAAGTLTLEGSEDLDAAVAMTGSTILVAREDGRLIVADAQSMTTRKIFQPQSKGVPRSVASAPGGRWFGIVFQNGRLYLLDAASGELSEPGIRGQGDVSAIGFPDSTRMLIADRNVRVTEYDIATRKVQKTLAPARTMTEFVYSCIILPIYTVFPKPGELKYTVNYVMTGEDTVALSLESSAMASRQTTRDPWGPVWSSLAFIVAVLAIACVYIERQQY